MLLVPSSQLSGVFPTLSYYGQQLDRPWKMALPFLKLNPVARRVCNFLNDSILLSRSLHGVFTAVRRRDVASARKHVVQSAMKVVGIVAAVFEYRVAKIAKDSLGLLNDLNEFVCVFHAYIRTGQDGDKTTRLFLTVIVSALSLSLTLVKSIDLLVLLEAASMMVSGCHIWEEVTGERRWPELIAHYAMFALRLHRSHEHCAAALERYYGETRVPAREVLEGAERPLNMTSLNTTSSFVDPVRMPPCLCPPSEYGDD